MSIGDVRLYFDTKINEVKTLTAYQYDAFGNNDINSTVAQKSYNLIITNVDVINQPEFFDRVYNCQLDIWSAKGVNYVTNLDQLFDEAEAIQENLVDVASVNIETCIYRVEPLAYEAIEEETNDNTFKIRLSFNVYSAAPITQVTN